MLPVVFYVVVQCFFLTFDVLCGGDFGTILMRKLSLVSMRVGFVGVVVFLCCPVSFSIPPMFNYFFFVLSTVCLYHLGHPLLLTKELG